MFRSPRPNAPPKKIVALTWALMWIIAGRRNASVFPLPVALIPTMFFPLRAMGHP